MSWRPPETGIGARARLAITEMRAALGEREDAVAAAVKAANQRLDEPMRVAVAGRVSQGKSTLVNALLQRPVASTGLGERTLVVNEFRYADDEQLIAHYHDGRQETVAVSSFERLSTFTPDGTVTPSPLRRLSYEISAPILAAIRIADTPGLGGLKGADAQWYLTALRRLGLRTEDVHNASAEEMHIADGVVYTSSRALGAFDLDFLKRFEDISDADGPALSTPLKTIGVLARCDQSYWTEGRPRETDPIATGRRSAQEMLNRDAQTRSSTYRLIPVAALVAEGACRLTETHLQWLADLPLDKPDHLVARLRDSKQFIHDDSLGLDQTRRGELIGILGGWGVWLARSLVQDGLGLDRIRRDLDRASGVAELRVVLFDHFGRRSAAIKWDAGLRLILSAISRHRDELRGRPDIGSTAVDRVAAIAHDRHANEHTFAELDLLNRHYLGQLPLRDEDGRKLERLTGRFGTTCAARLDVDEHASLADLRDAGVMERDYWSRLAALPSAGGPVADRAAEVMRDLCDHLVRVIDGAWRMLDVDDR